jgi:hypothetical protein
MATNGTPQLSDDEWLRLLRTQADGFWGTARAGDLANSLRRMAGAIARVAARQPAGTTAPFPPNPPAGGGGGRNG